MIGGFGTSETLSLADILLLRLTPTSHLLKKHITSCYRPTFIFFSRNSNCKERQESKERSGPDAIVEYPMLVRASRSYLINQL